MPERLRAPTHVQRWRLTLHRSADAPDLPQRDLQAAWQDGLAAAVRSSADIEPPRFVPAAPIPAGLTSDGERADVFLAERMTLPQARARFASALPTGYALVDLHDVWLGESPLPGQVEAADYRVELAPVAPGRPPSDDDMDTAIEALLATETLERLRTKPGVSAAGNLRPLILAVRRGDPGWLWMRLRFDPVLGTGRPEEVVAALGRLMGCELSTLRRHRERLWLRGEPRDDPAAV